MTYGALSTEPLTRARDGYIAGVCEGVAKRLGVEALWIRLAWIAALLFFGTGFIAYLAMWWVVPREGSLQVEATIWKPDPSGQHHPPLRRTVRDRKVLGVCGGLARAWGMDPSLLRLATLALAVCSLGVAALVYLLLAVAIPPAHASTPAGP